LGEWLIGRGYGWVGGIVGVNSVGERLVGECTHCGTGDSTFDHLYGRHHGLVSGEMGDIGYGLQIGIDMIIHV
jgi:hypothetical protein